MRSKSSSGLGLILIVTGVILLYSPEARRFVRNLLAKGVSGLIDALDEMKRGVQMDAQQQSAQPANEANDGDVGGSKVEKVLSLDKLLHAAQSKGVGAVTTAGSDGGETPNRT